VLNEIVWTGLKQALLQPELLVSAAIGAQSRRSITTGLTHEQIDRGLDTLKTEESRLLEAYKRGILTPDLLAEELRKVNAQRAAIRARHTIEPSVPQQISPELIRRSLGRLRDLISQELSSWTVEERQRLLRLIIRTVLIEQDKVRIQAQIPIDEGSPDEFLSNQTRVPPTPHFGYGRIAPTSLGEDGRNEASKTTSCAAEFELIFPLPADFQAHKDARTGRFVTAAHAEGHGETTKHVAVRIPKRQ